MDFPDMIPHLWNEAGRIPDFGTIPEEGRWERVVDNLIFPGPALAEISPARGQK
jgi:hypothetical protein